MWRIGRLFRAYVQLTLSSKWILKRHGYRTNLKLGTAKINTVIVFKVDQSGFTVQSCVKKDADELANSVNPDQTAPWQGAV